MRHTLTWCLALFLAPLSMADGQACRPADANSAYFVSDLRDLTASARPEDVNQRRDLMIPVVDSSTVVLVTDNKVCEKALTTYNSTVVAGQPQATHVYVVKVGTVYVAFDPDRPSAAAERYAVMKSNNYSLLARYAK